MEGLRAFLGTYQVKDVWWMIGIGYPIDILWECFAIDEKFRNHRMIREILLLTEVTL